MMDASGRSTPTGPRRKRKRKSALQQLRELISARRRNDARQVNRPKPVMRRRGGGGFGISWNKRNKLKKQIDYALADDDDGWDNAEEKPLAQCVFEPDSKGRLFWDVAIVFFILYNVVTTPLFIGFGSVIVKPVWMAYFDGVIDAAFILDIFLSFRTVVTQQVRGEEIRIVDTAVIVRHYIGYWFWIDLLSVGIPFNLGANLSSDLKLLSLIKLLRLLRVGRIFNRLFTIKPQAAKLVRIVQMVFLLLGTSHVFGCFFWWIAMKSVDPELPGGDSSSWTSGSASFVGFCAEKTQDAMTGDFTCIVDDNPSNNTIPHYDQVQYGYFEALYWAIMTLTTVGYGDISAGNMTEMIYSSIIMIIGAIVYAIILGHVTAAVQTLDSAKQPLLDKLERLQNFIGSNSYGINESLSDHILQTHQCVARPSRAIARRRATRWPPQATRCPPPPVSAARCGPARAATLTCLALCLAPRAAARRLVQIHVGRQLELR